MRTHLNLFIILVKLCSMLCCPLILFKDSIKGKKYTCHVRITKACKTSRFLPPWIPLSKENGLLLNNIISLFLYKRKFSPSFDGVGYFFWNSFHEICFFVAYVFNQSFLCIFQQVYCDKVFFLEIIIEQFSALST